MQVENIECQIAQAQIGNFLAGSGLSEEAMQQLEEHIAGCTNCKAALNERRSELKAMLTGERAVVDFEQIAREAEGTKAKNIATALRKKSLQQMLEPTQELPFVHQPQPRAAAVEQPASAPEVPQKQAAQTPATPKAAKTPAKWKPLAYSLALAAVLVGMSLFSSNIASIFGPRASESGKLVSNSPTPPATDPVATAVPDTKTVEPTGTSTVNPQPTGATDTTGTTGSEPMAAETASNPVTDPGKAEPNDGINTPPVTPVQDTEPVVEPAFGLGASAGALATTQFQSTESLALQTPAAKPAIKPAAKPVVKTAPAKPVLTRRITPRRIVRKPIRRTGRKPVVRSRGIKVYNP